MERLHVGAPAVLAELRLGFVMAQVLTDHVHEEASTIVPSPAIRVSPVDASALWSRDKPHVLFLTFGICEPNKVVVSSHQRWFLIHE